MNKFSTSSHWHYLTVAGFTCAITCTTAFSPLSAQEIQPSTDSEVAITDTDQDGISDTLEVDAGTDANNPDTDGDGLLDGEEVIHFRTDPTLSLIHI